MAKTRTRDRVLKYLANHAHRAYRPKELSKKLGITDNDEYRRFRSDVSALVEARLVDVHRGGRIQHKRPSRTPTGRISITRKGFGFVTVEGFDEDVYVSASNTGTSLDGDLVRLEIFARDRRGGRRGRSIEGEVVEIVERARAEAVGTFREHGRLGFVVPDDQRLTRDIYVNAEHDAKSGDKVVVSIEEFEHPRGAPEGRILKIIGPQDDPGVRVASLAMSLGVRVDYPEEAEREAVRRAAIIDPIPEAEVARRIDLRNVPTVTIDPDDAKDFDDAVSVEPRADGGFLVHVHVADVGSFVQSGTALDDEAFARATSVYLVDRVVPMLPHVLSAGSCSLRPEEDRLAMTCTVELDAKGRARSSEVRESVIRSDYRLTYHEAQSIIDGGDHACAQLVRDAARVSRLLRQLRVDRGSIEFDLPEVKVVLDEDGVVTAVRPRERLEAHRLIEELMLLANRSVATMMHDERFVYRVHAAPDIDKLSQVARYVGLFGYELPLDQGRADPGQINTLLQAIRGSAQEPIIQSALLRAMSKAEYSTNNVGHYGLALKEYTHFTSPIRRYPDLIVHRLLKQKIGAVDRSVEVAPNGLDDAAKHCSERERTAVDAERASVKLKQVEYARQHVGDEFAGVISGVSQFGIFVQLTELLVEGMVHVRDIGDDFYEYDESTYSLVGTRTGKQFRVGMEVTVIIVRADTEAREIDLFLTDEDEK